MGRARFWELVGVGLLILGTAAFLGNGVFALGHVFRTEPGVILGVIALIVLGFAGSIVGIGSILARVRKR